MSAVKRLSIITSSFDIDRDFRSLCDFWGLIMQQRTAEQICLSVPKNLIDSYNLSPGSPHPLLLHRSPVQHSVQVFLSLFRLSSISSNILLSVTLYVFPLSRLPTLALQNCYRKIPNILYRFTLFCHSIDIRHTFKGIMLKGKASCDQYACFSLYFAVALCDVGYV